MARGAVARDVVWDLEAVIPIGIWTVKGLVLGVQRRLLCVAFLLTAAAAVA